MKESYSLENYKKAKSEGLDELPPHEKEFLDTYNEHERNKLNGMDKSDKLTLELLAAALRQAAKDLVDYKEWLFIAKYPAVTAMELEDKRSRTVAGQIEAAHEEAIEVNRRYDELAANIEKAVSEFDQFVASLNRHDQQ